MLEDEKVVATLEMSLRQFNSAKMRLAERLEKIELEIDKLQREANGLNAEIAALENSGKAAEEALNNLLKEEKSQ